jgi:hypothetical protein
LISTGDSAPLTEAEFNTGKAAFINMLTPKFKEQNHVVSNITPMTVRDLGQPPNLDVRKNANPHSTDYYTKGAVYPPKWSSGGW